MSFVAVVEARTGVACCWRAPLLRGSGPIPRRLRDGLDLAEGAAGLGGAAAKHLEPILERDVRHVVGREDLAAGGRREHAAGLKRLG